MSRGSGGRGLHWLVHNIDEYKSCRTISNLTFLSKVTEKVVASQPVGHLQVNNFYKFFSQHAKDSTALKLPSCESDINSYWQQQLCVTSLLLTWSVLRSCYIRCILTLHKVWHWWESTWRDCIVPLRPYTVCPSEWHSVQKAHIRVWRTTRLCAWALPLLTVYGSIDSHCSWL